MSGFWPSLLLPLVASLVLSRCGADRARSFLNFTFAFAKFAFHFALAFLKCSEFFR